MKKKLAAAVVVTVVFAMSGMAIAETKGVRQPPEEASLNKPAPHIAVTQQKEGNTPPPPPDGKKAPKAGKTPPPPPKGMPPKGKTRPPKPKNVSDRNGKPIPPRAEGERQQKR